MKPALINFTPWSNKELIAWVQSHQATCDGCNEEASCPNMEEACETLDARQEEAAEMHLKGED